MNTIQITIGCPEFWSEFNKAHAVRLQAIMKLPELINLMFTAFNYKGSPRLVEKIVNGLTRVTVTSLNDVLVLCGNGSGTGALKIVRGMFESSTVAEYLRLHPGEAQDYDDFQHVIAWRRYQQIKNVSGDTLSTDRIELIQKKYDGVKARFAVRSQWSRRSIRKMASAIGRDVQYELVYSWLSSLHHLNHEGLMAHMEPMKVGEPSLYVTEAALVGSHTYVIWALQTFNDCCELGLHDKLGEAKDDFRNCLKTNDTNPPEVAAWRNQT